MKNKGALWVTTTAVFIALLIGAQAVTASFGALVTGSLVNLMLIMAVMTGGFTSGLAVAVVSPFVAKLVGIGPMWTLIPFIAAGNIVLILVWNYLGRMKFANTHIIRIIAMITAAACKCAFLYLGIVRLALPLFLTVPAPQAAVITKLFSIQQLFTALIGGALATAILPVIEKIRTKRSD